MKIPGFTVWIEADSQIAFMSSDREVVRDGRTLMRQTMSVGGWRTWRFGSWSLGRLAESA
jgi:hypothetical protein